MIDYITIMGFVAGAFTTFSFIPQVARSMRTKSTKDISWYWICILLGGLVLWIIYGVMIGSAPIAIWNFVSLFTTFPMVVLKLKYG